MWNNDLGQFALIDLIIFISIIILASSIQFYSQNTYIDNEISSVESIGIRAEQTLDVFLRTTIEVEACIFKPVSELLGEELIFSSNLDNTELEYIDRQLEKLLLKLTLPSYGFDFLAESGTGSYRLTSISETNLIMDLHNRIYAERYIPFSFNGQRYQIHYSLGLWRL